MTNANKRNPGIRKKRQLFFVHFLVLAFAWAISPASFAQQSFETTETADKKSVRWHEKSLEEIRSGDYQKALSLLDKALERSPLFVDAYIRRGNIYYDLRELTLAKTNYEKALDLTPEYRPIVWYQLAMTEWRMEDFAASASHFRKYLSLDPRNERQIQLAREYEKDASFAAEATGNPVPFDPIRLGPAINTPNQEYLPSLTADEQVLIYTAVINRQEDFFIARKENGEWQQGRPITSVNTKLNEGAQTISANGRLLIFTACNRIDAVGRCDLYYSEYKNGEWTPVRNLGPPVNSGAWESQPSLSADGKELYFASDRPGSIGQKDIWVSYRKEDGSWGVPQNLGDQINTAKDDKGPFIHPDGQTLYFMSNGLPGLGGFDLYYARKQNDGSWGDPVNLGFPINSQLDEGLLVVSLNGKTAYFASDRVDLIDGTVGTWNVSDQRKDYDIFTFDLYEEARPQPVTYVKGLVVDKLTGLPLQAEVDIQDLSTGLQSSRTTTDEQGTFLTVLPAGKNYGLAVAKKGYLFYSDHFALENATSLDSPFVLTIELQPIPEEETAGPASEPIVLRNVFFETGSAKLKANSKAELDRLFRLLDENPGLRIQINGHTDNVGTEEDNQVLSKNRAKAVYDYLVEKGIDEQRLRYEGFGETAPVATNETPEGRQQNRRTEFQIIQ